MTSDIPVPTEKDYLDAARANAAVYFAESGLEGFGHYFDETAKRIAKRPDFRAAVDSAYAAGWRAHAAQTRKALPMCNNGEVVMVTDMAAYLRGRAEVPSGLSRESNPASTERTAP